MSVMKENGRLKQNLRTTFSTSKYMLGYVWRSRSGKGYILMKSFLSVLGAVLPLGLVLLPGLIINELTGAQRVDVLLWYIAATAGIPAQAGIAVPARSYRCSVFRYISVHFPRGEGKQLSAGLFEDEIKRLKSDMDRIKNHALILMNESFSTTVESEAEQLASDVIAALAHIGSSVFFVTHFYDFAVRIDELNRRLGGGTVAVNLVTRKYEKPNSRTDYQIVRGDPIPNYRIRLQDFI